MNNNFKLSNISNEVGEILQNAKNPAIYSAHQLLHSRIINPKSFITFIGETSSGKSTLINGIIKKSILPISAAPTTGTITQLLLSDTDKTEYYAINRNATIELLDKEKFRYFTKNPDKEMLRLCIELSAPDTESLGMNIFDTPGFNSIICEHEEILREFIPQSDVVILVVNYRVGFGVENKELLNLISELFKQDVNMPVLLAINRCPIDSSIDNNRIKEITDYASDSLHQKLCPFIINSINPTSDQLDILPRNEKMWKEIIRHANSIERDIIIERKVIILLLELIDNMILECENRLIATKLDDEAILALKSKQEGLKDNLNNCFLIVDKHIKRLETNLPKIIFKKTNELIDLVKKEIYDSNKWIEAQMCSTFISAHTLPFNIRKIVREVEDYICQTFDEMDIELSEMANKAIYHINDNANQLHSPELSVNSQKK